MTPRVPVLDRLGRGLDSLRISVTDRCNLRCSYCMPESEYAWLRKQELLSFEELTHLVRVFVSLGVRRVRLTGGEPLLRADLAKLVAMLRGIQGLQDLALTTNGVLLADHAEALKAAGLDRVTVSLDTLRPERFLALTRRDEHHRVLDGIRAAAKANLAPLKLDSVILRGTNDDELGELLELGRELGAEVRFIEYMDVGGATRWTPDAVVSRREMLARIGERYGEVRAIGRSSTAPAETFALPDGLVFGVIASVTEPFCATCDRARLTADGKLLLCLYAREGRDLRRVVRAAGSTEQSITDAVREAWSARDDRGAEARLRVGTREPLVNIGELRRDPHLEMHTRGG